MFYFDVFKQFKIFMNSSAGFKKRSLLRPPSGIISNQRQFLKVFDISQNENIISTNIRTQLASIQEQINLLDKDKKIRTSEISLEKLSILNLKKWLKEAQVQCQKEDEDIKILQYMGTVGYQAGFKKLWKLLTHLDLMISKITELQIVQFLKFNQSFEEMAKDSPNGERILQAIAKTGFNVSNFHLSQLGLERYQEVYGAASKLKRESLSSGSSRTFLNETKENTHELLQELRNENKKLTDLLDQLGKEKQQNSKNTTDKSSKPMFSELQQKYEGQVASLYQQINKLNKHTANQKIQIQSLESQLMVAEEELKSEDYKQNRKPKAGTYEQALLQELSKMKKGFQKRIKRLVEEFSLKEKESRKRQSETKNENDRLIWEKALLLKKFDSLSS